MFDLKRNAIDFETAEQRIAGLEHLGERHVHVWLRRRLLPMQEKARAYQLGVANYHARYAPKPQQESTKLAHNDFDTSQDEEQRKTKGEEEEEKDV